jgi:hypothetical protein
MFLSLEGIPMAGSVRVSRVAFADDAVKSQGGGAA